MEVSKLSSLFKSIVPQIVAGNGSKPTNVKRFSNFEPGDTFVGKPGKAVSGQALASASHGDIPIQQAGRHIANAFEAFAKNLAA